MAQHESNQPTGGEVSGDQQAETFAKEALRKAEEARRREAEANAQQQGGATPGGGQPGVRRSFEPIRGNKYVLGAGKALGSAILLLVKMLRELFQGVFGKIMNKDLKGERKALEDEVKQQKNALSDLQGAERDIGREIKKEKETLQEVKEKSAQTTKGISGTVTSNEGRDGLRAFAASAGAGAGVVTSHPPIVNQEHSETLKSGRSHSGGLGHQEAEWIKKVKDYDNDHDKEAPIDRDYLNQLMGGDVRHAVSREALDEVSRLRKAFDIAREKSNSYSVDARFPQMLAATCYLEAVSEVMKEKIDNAEESIEPPTRFQVQEAIEDILPRVISKLREGGDDVERWADGLSGRLHYNQTQLDNMRAGLSRIGVKLRESEGGHSIGQSQPKDSNKNRGLPGPSNAPPGL